VQKVVGLGRAARAQTGFRTRQPLGRLLLRVPDDATAEAAERHRDQILEELNVKELEFIARDAELVEYRIKPNLPRIGKRYGKLVPAIREALAAADGATIAAAAAAGRGFTVEAGGETLEFGPEDVLVETSSAEGFACAEEGGYLVALDTRLDDALVREGLARELVRTVQDARKQAGLEVSDRIALSITGSPSVEQALSEYRDYVMHETLAVDWAPADMTDAWVTEKRLDDEEWRIALRVSGGEPS
jgi:isoleucyl-tRNA synthetase